MNWDLAKQAAAKAAVSIIEQSMTVGLGTGSTAAYFIEALKERIDAGLRLKAAVASSIASFDLAKRLGLPVCDLADVPSIDITVDGADEIDPAGRMIKGGGGAHVREKILASASKEFVIIADETKLVKTFEKHPLPVEILSYGAHFTKAHLEKSGYRGYWRMKSDGSRFVSDNGNFILDIALSHIAQRPEEIQSRIMQTPGVVDTGFFFHLATQIIIGRKDGQTETRRLRSH